MAHILIVDDEAEIRFLVRVMLETAGHSTFEGRDGQHALDILQTHPDPFDMILLDIRMPRMNGAGFLAAVDTQLFPTPIIILTAHQGWDYIPETLAQKVSGYLYKPFRRHELTSVVDSVISSQINLSPSPL